jgi:hypothetical protein
LGYRRGLRPQIAERFPGKITLSRDVCADGENYGGTLEMDLQGPTPQVIDRTLLS